MGLRARITTELLLVFGLGCLSHAADLKVVVLDSKSGHALHGKLVCILVPAGKSEGPVVYPSRECRRTDSGGTAAFALPDPAPETVKVELSTNGLVPCFASQPFVVADAMKDGMVAKNTCGDADTSTTETGEVVLFAHQKGVKETLGSARNEF